MKYSKTEIQIIKDCKEMGYTNKTIAQFVNKKIHHNKQVRTSEGVRKIK